MGRANLSQLLGNVGDEPKPEDALEAAPELHVEPPEASASVSAASPEAGPSSLPEKRTTAPPASPRAPSSKAVEVEPGAAYLRFVRKETRLRDDQQNALTLHARRLSRARSMAGPRITENSLIRIAVDLLLARIDSGQGDDEASILRSLNQ